MVLRMTFLSFENVLVLENTRASSAAEVCDLMPPGS